MNGNEYKHALKWPLKIPIFCWLHQLGNATKSKRSLMSS